MTRRSPNAGPNPQMESPPEATNERKSREESPGDRVSTRAVGPKTQAANATRTHSIPVAVRDDTSFDFEAKEQDAETAEPGVIPAEGGNGQVIAPTSPEATPSQREGGEVIDTAPLPGEEAGFDRQADREELARLESAFEEGENGHRQAIQALREIRRRDLYKLPGYFQGRPEGFPTFDEYVECRWSKTRNWVTQETNWLAACECLEAHGKAPYQFSKQSIQCAAYLLDSDPEGFCEVYLDAAKNGLPVTEAAMKAALKRYTSFALLRSDWGRWQDAAKVPVPQRAPLTRAEAALVDFEWQRRSYSKNLVDEAKGMADETGRNWRECLPEVCREARLLPMPTHLLAAARGEDLEEVVLALRPLAKEWAEQAELSILEKKVKELRKKAGVTKGKRGKKVKGEVVTGGSVGADAGAGEEDDGGEQDAGGAGAADGGEGEVVEAPPAAEVVDAVERKWGPLAVPYLFEAGIQFWQVAFERSTPADERAKDAALTAMRELMTYIEQP